MDSIKCDRFKTFREELPSKKFQFLNENDSIHKMKIVDEDSSSQNKANEAVCKILKEHFEKQEDEISTLPQLAASTGMFRDNLRRIDMVLVVEDNPSSNMDNLKITFLSNILKTGLEVELESGLMPAHKRLSFIKIHAPNKVLIEYGEIFGVKRYFIDNRLDTISPKLTKFAKMFKIFNNENEREWIKIVRNNYTTPNGYSHFERSLIVYKILLHLPFGDHANHYGINRHTASKLLLASKRPLHIRSPGIGAWNKMFLFTAYAAIITNAITLVFSTRLILRYYFLSRNKPLNTTLDFVLVQLRTDERYFRKKECYSPEFLEPVGTTHKAETFRWMGLLDDMTRKSEYHMFSIYRVVFIFLFIHIVAFVGFLLKYLFPPIIREIEETKAAERRIKTLYRHYKDAQESKEQNRFVYS